MDRQAHDYASASAMAYAQQQRQPPLNIQQQQQQFGYLPQHQQFPPSGHGPPPFLSAHLSLQQLPYHQQFPPPHPHLVHLQQQQQQQQPPPAFPPHLPSHLVHSPYISGPYDATPPPPSGPPSDPELHKRIDKLVEYSAKNGPEFEAMIREKQKDNPEYRFLFGDEGHNYYRYKLWLSTRPPTGLFNPVPMMHNPNPMTKTSPINSASGAPGSMLGGPQLHQHPFSPFYDQMQHHQHPLPFTGQSRQGFDQSSQPFKGLSGPLPSDVATELSSVLTSLSGTKESIKGAKIWFMQRSPFAPALAEALRERVFTVDDSERQLHIIYLANDILFDSASLASLTRETGPNLVKGDQAKKIETPKVSHVSKQHFTHTLNIIDSALKFTHILYNLSPSVTCLQEKTVLFTSYVDVNLQRRINPHDLDNEALAFKPVLGSMLARIYHNPHNKEENQSRLQKILQFWASKEVYDQNTIYAFESEMLGGPPPNSFPGPPKEITVAQADTPIISGLSQPNIPYWQSDNHRSEQVERQTPAVPNMTQAVASHQFLPNSLPVGAFPGQPLPHMLPTPPSSSAEKLPPYPLFPPGLIPGMVRKMQIGSGVPYSPMSPLDIPTVIPPSTVPPSETLERVSKFFKEIGEINPSEGPMKQSESNDYGDEYDREEIVRKGGACIPPPSHLRADPETGTYPDGTVEKKPGSSSSGRLGLGASANPNEASQYDDVYSSYRKNRSTNYHTSMSARATAR